MELRSILILQGFKLFKILLKYYFIVYMQSTIFNTPEFSQMAANIMKSKKSGKSPGPKVGVSYADDLEARFNILKSNLDKCYEQVSSLNEELSKSSETNTILKEEIKRLTPTEGSVTPPPDGYDSEGGMRKRQKSRKLKKSRKLQKSRKYKKYRK